MEPESEAKRRARILAELERSLAEGLPAADDAGWQYPPAPVLDVSPAEPPLSRGILAFLGAVVAVVVVALVAVAVEGATIPACQILPACRKPSPTQRPNRPTA
jgi:hypothetical protein